MKSMEIYKKYKEQVNYLFFGFVTTVITLITYYLLATFCFNPDKAFELQFANIVSWIIGVLFAFIVNKKYVFESTNNSKNQIVKFILSRLITLFFDLVIMFLFVSLLKYDDFIIKLLSQIGVIIGNYVLSKFFVFTKRELSLINLFNKGFVACFFAIVFIGFTTLFRSPINYSYLENRLLYKFEFPTIRTFLNKSFQDKTENALTDQILFGQSIRKKGIQVFQFLGSSDIDNKICKGRNVYIYPEYIRYDCNSQILKKSIGNFNNDIVNKNINIFSNINNYIDTYYYVLNRDYTWDFSHNELLFDGYVYLKEHLAGDYHISQLDINSYDDYIKYFYLTDHHWNHIGSYRGYRDIIKLLNVKDKILKPTKEIKLKNKFFGSQAKNSKVINMSEDFIYYDFDIKDHFEYINGFRGQYGDYTFNSNIDYMNLYASVYGGDYAEILYDFNNSEKDNLLIIGTSYTNPINRLVASHYNKTYILDPRHYRNFDGSYVNIREYIDDHHIDKVLILASTDMLDGSIDGLKWGD